MRTNNNYHGSPHDRGSADAWYGRDPIPHYYEGATGMSLRIDMEEMTSKEIAEYQDGYDAQVATGECKLY